ncbi:hypothetical protein ACFC63_33010, partial [Streptomyces albidoflavus]
MAIGSGLGAQLGIAAETTYGTYVAPSKFIEFTQESLALKKTTAQSAGIAAGRLLALSSRRRVRASPSPSRTPPGPSAPTCSWTPSRSC